MKKIIHFFDVLTMGGAQTQLLSVLPYLDKKDYEHIICSLTDKMDMAKEFEGMGFKVKNLDLQNELKSKKWAKVARGVTAMLNAENADIVETHQMWSRIFTALCGLWLHKKPRFIAVFQGEAYYRNFYYRAANFIASLFIDKMASSSDYLRKWLGRYYLIPSKKIIVMHNTVSPEVLKPDPGRRERGRNEFGIEKDAIAIVSTGILGIRTNKGMEYCVDAIAILKKRHKNIKLFIVGEGKRRADLERQIETLGLKEAVILLGLRRDIPYILDICDIFVSASVYESCSIAIIEAMAMEKPVVASPVGGMPEIIKDGFNGFFAKLCDAQDFARVIERLIVDKELRFKMGKLAREDVQKRFNSAGYARRLQSIYEEH